MSTARILVPALVVALAACKREQPQSPVTPEPAAAPAPAPPAAPTPAPTPAAPPAAAGLTAHLEAAEYKLDVALTPGAQPAFSLELRGNGEYHVNEQYPVAVELTPVNATLPKTSLRRVDAAEFTQQLARFTQPVTSTGPGTTVRGNVRFGVCRAEQCGFFNRDFAVAMP